MIEIIYFAVWGDLPFESYRACARSLYSNRWTAGEIADFFSCGLQVDAAEYYVSHILLRD